MPIKNVTKLGQKKKKKIVVERGEEYTYRKPKSVLKIVPFQFCSKDKNKKTEKN
jgi:hypothetical protein